MSVAITQFNGYGLRGSTLILPSTGIFTGTNKRRRLLLISVKERREGVNIQTSTEPGTLLVESPYCQSEPNWAQIASPVREHRAVPAHKTKAGVGAKHTLAEGPGAISLGRLRRELQSEASPTSGCRGAGVACAAQAWGGQGVAGLGTAPQRSETDLTQCPQRPQLEASWAAGSGRQWHWAAAIRQRSGAGGTGGARGDSHVSFCLGVISAAS